MVDTFSNMVVASAHKGETTSDSKHHLLYTSFLGRPLQLKTDDGPVYSSKRFKEFCNLWTISHITVISYNAENQLFLCIIVEWQIKILKCQL